MYRAGLTGFFIFVFGLWMTAAAVAQQLYVQVEAQPNLRQAEERARAYSSALPNVVGFRLSSGWYALALGPYPTEPEARSALLQLRRAGIIPGDSYTAARRQYGQQFWPVGGGTAVAPAAPAPAETVEAPAPAQPAAPVELEETPREARASEALLDRPAREQLQVALQWFGFYTSTIDGSFGRGTRAAMGRWQAAEGLEATGILTTKQRAQLLADYDAALARLGLGVVEEDVAGITITMPAKLVEFAGYDYPFVRYTEKDGSGVQVLLISQAGDEQSLAGLYEIMQTLEIVPLEGERSKNRTSFTLTGANTEIQSYTHAVLRGGYVKGFTLVYPPAKTGDMAQVIEIMRDSFTLTEGTIDPGQIDEAAQAVDLMAGLELRSPKLSRSGFYVDNRGAVLTSASAVDQCDRITIDSDYEAELVGSTGDLALLRPKSNLVPLDFARLALSLGRLRSEVAVAGYSYQGQLAAPSVTFGRLEDIRGLDGDERLKRVSLNTLPGDVGGPVLDMTGAVTGLLLPAAPEGRALPVGTAFALKAEELAAFLAENGVAASASTGESSLGPEALSARAADMTVLVGCW